MDEPTKRRLAFLLAGMLLFFGLILLPVGLPRTVGTFAVLGLLFERAWHIRRRPCVICGRPDTCPAPRYPSKVRPWWDLRLPSRKDFAWVCPAHLEGFMDGQLGKAVITLWFATRPGSSEESDDDHRPC